MSGVEVRVGSCDIYSRPWFTNNGGRAGEQGGFGSKDEPTLYVAYYHGHILVLSPSPDKSIRISSLKPRDFSSLHKVSSFYSDTDFHTRINNRNFVSRKYYRSTRLAFVHKVSKTGDDTLAVV